MAETNPYENQAAIEPEAWADAQSFSDSTNPYLNWINSGQGTSADSPGFRDAVSALNRVSGYGISNTYGMSEDQWNNLDLGAKLLLANAQHQKQALDAWQTRYSPQNDFSANYAAGWNQGNDYQDYYKNEMSRAQGRGNIAFNNANEQESRQAQQALIQQLHGLAQGDTSFSTAQKELQGNARLASGNAAGLVAARGNYGDGGVAMRAAQQQQQSIRAGAQDASTALQAQEQAAAQALLGQLYASQQAGDIQAATNAAQIGTQNKYGNLNYQTELAAGGSGAQLDRYQLQQDIAASRLAQQYQQEKMNKEFLNNGLNSFATLFGQAATADGNQRKTY